MDSLAKIESKNTTWLCYLMDCLLVIYPCHGNPSCDHAIRSSVASIGIDGRKVDSGSASEARSVLKVGVSASIRPSWIDAESGIGGFTVFLVNCGNTELNPS
jgi:hypothetical protein